MKLHPLFRPAVAAAAGLLLAGSGASAVGLFSEVVLIEGDQFTGTSIEFASSDSGAPVSVSGGVSYDTEVLGGSGDLVFTGSGSAQAGYQFLRSSASGSLSNSYFDPDYNFDNGTGDVPTSYVTQSIARFEETLVYGGTATGYNSKYFFRVTGNITGQDASAFVQLTHASAPSQFWFFDSPGGFNEIIVSESFVGAPNLGFSLELVSSFDASTEFLDDGGSSSGAAQFGSTVELLGIEARDAVTGDLLSTLDFTSGSGTVYPIRAVVPEPTTAWLAASVLLFAPRTRS